MFEDPFLWYDPAMKRWLLLMHQYNHSDISHQTLDGGFAYSATTELWSEWTWGSFRDAAYTSTVRYDDGTTDVMVRRERPSILFNATTGRPEVSHTRSVFTLIPFFP